MGCNSSSDSDLTSEEAAKQNKANKLINSKMVTDNNNDRQEKKLLLLGTGGSGKSTIFKNLKKVNGEEISDDRTVVETANTVRGNLTQGMYTLLSKSQYLYDMDPKLNQDCMVQTDDEEIVQAIRLVVQFGNESFGDECMITPEEMIQLGNAIDKLWKLKSIQQTFSKRGGVFSFPDNLDYFYNKITDVMKPTYKPTEEDVIKARVRTTGVVKFVYEKGDTIFAITDVGGQRNERKKWIHQFENVAAVIFVAALNHYNAVLFEDEKKNAMHEAVDLFHEIATTKWFRKSELILFLNKEDLFTKALKDGAPLGVCFSFDAGWKEEQWEGTDYSPKQNEEEDDKHFDQCYKEAVQFIQDVFISRNDVQNRVVFSHVTRATDHTNVEKVFWDVQNIVIRSNLKKGGLMV